MAFVSWCLRVCDGGPASLSGGYDGTSGRLCGFAFFLLFSLGVFVVQTGGPSGMETVSVEVSAVGVAHFDASFGEVLFPAAGDDLCGLGIAE